MTNPRPQKQQQPHGEVAQHEADEKRCAEMCSRWGAGCNRAPDQRGECQLEPTSHPANLMSASSPRNGNGVGT